MSCLGRLHSMASGSFRDAKLERPVSGAELRRLLVASRPTAVIRRDKMDDLGRVVIRSAVRQI